MSEDERVVRDAWEKIFDRETIVAGHGWMVRLPIIWHESMTDGYFRSKDEAWSAARKFTDKRREDIRLVRRDISWVEDFVGDARDSILARLQADLDDLLKGWRQ